MTKSTETSRNQFMLDFHYILRDSRIQFAIFALMAVLTGTCGVASLERGFEEYRDLDAFAPLETTPAAAAPAGPVLLEGEVEALDELVEDGWTRTPSVVVEAVQQVRRGIGDDAEWVDVSREVFHRAFILRDDSGAVVVEVDPDVQIIARKRHKDRRVETRWLEYRVEPKDRVVVLGEATPVVDDPLITSRIDLTRDAIGYTPFLSNDDARRAELHGHQTTMALIFITMGMGGVLAALIFLLYALRIHRVTTSLLILILGICAVLVWTSVESARDTVASRHAFAQHLSDTTQHQFDGIVGTDSFASALKWHEPIPFEELDHLSDEERDQLRLLQETMARQLATIDGELRRFPESLHYDSDEFPTISFPSTEASVSADAGNSISSRVDWNELGLLIFFALFAGICAHRGMERIQLKRLMEVLEVSDIGQATYGLNALCGRVICDDPVETPKKKTPSIWYDFRAGRPGGSKKGSEKRHVGRFTLRDDTGCIDVLLSGIEAKTDYSVGTPWGEHCIPANCEALYVLGCAEICNEDYDRLVLSKSGPSELRGLSSPPFLMSNLPEERLHLAVGRDGIILLAAAIGFVSLLGLRASMVFGGRLEPVGLLYASALSLFAVCALLIFMSVRDLNFLRRRVDDIWSKVNSRLEQRFHVLDEMVNLVGSHLEVGGELLHRIDEMRRRLGESSGFEPSEAREMDERQRLVFERCRALAQRDGELEEDSQLEELIQRYDELTGDIEFVGIGYDEAVERFNSRIGRLPTVLLAWPTGFRPMEKYDGGQE